MKTSMKRIAAILACFALMTGAAAACAESAPAREENVVIGMANPWTEVESLEELNEIAHTSLVLPAVMGVTDVSCRVMHADAEHPLAELTFKVNGYDYTMRACNDWADDITGVYTENGALDFSGYSEDMQVYTNKEIKLARWCDRNTQYTLMVSDHDAMDEDTFLLIAEEMSENTAAAALPAVAEGTYYDTVSRRAYAEVTALGDDTYAITVNWADSAMENNVWTMTARAAEDGSLYYTDCVKTHVVTAADGTETVTVMETDPEGTFLLLENGCLSWTGASEEDCANCMFEAAQF